MSDHVQVEQQESVLIIRLNRPEKKNALTAAMYNTICKTLATADKNDDIRVILFCAQPEVFTSGNDLKDFLAQDNSEEPAAIKLLRQLATQKKPIVAATSGIAVGIGVTLLLHCDLVYLGDSTRLRLPFVNLALVPEAASSLLLPMLTGRQRASELLMLGDFFDSQKALEWGIANGIAPNNEVFNTALHHAKALAAKPKDALILTKQLITGTHRDEVLQRINEEGQLFRERLESAEAREVMAAFFSGKSSAP